MTCFRAKLPHVIREGIVGKIGAMQAFGDEPPIDAILAKTRSLPDYLTRVDTFETGIPITPLVIKKIIRFREMGDSWPTIALYLGISEVACRRAYKNNV